MSWKFFNASGQEKRASILAPSSVPIEDWHLVGGAGQPAFTNSWGNPIGAYPAQFRKRPDGVVELRGLIDGGAVTTSAFTLPVGYRPEASQGDVFFAAVTRTGASTYVLGGFYVSSLTGFVVPVSIGDNYISLTASFATDQATFPTGPAGPDTAAVNALRSRGIDTLTFVGGTPNYASTLTVAHGLGVAPTHVFATPRVPVANGATRSVIVEPDPSTFTTTTFQARGVILGIATATSMPFSWEAVV